MPNKFRLLFAVAAIIGALGVADAQTLLTCNVASVPAVVRAEGLTERTGDIVLNCSGGQPGSQVTGNLSVFLNVNITNRLTAGVLSDVVFTVDNGSGPQLTNVQGTLTGTNALVFNGLSFALSSSGTVSLRLANIRAAATQSALFPSGFVQATLAFNGSLISLTNNQFLVAETAHGLYATFSSKIICGPKGSQIPQNPLSFANLAASGATFNTTRLTEGFGDAFNSLTQPQSLNADTGTRLIVHYSGFPPGAQLFVPDVIAGSDAVQPTAETDLGLQASGGQYAPSANGSLLLARVANANPNGVGGLPVYTPGALGSGVVAFDSMSQLTLTNGATFVVYEVVDANPSVLESAQFPTFLGIGPIGGDPILTSEDVSLAPVSTVTAATATDPIPRFLSEPAQSDCGIIGDCDAFYFPKLYVAQSSLQYKAQAGSAFQTAYFQLGNSAGGALNWTVLSSYATASGWLQISPVSGTGNATVRVDALPGNLSAGTYYAVLTVNAGLAGSRDIAVTLVITAAPPAIQVPIVSGILNGAIFSAGPLAPGSIATITGSKFGGNKVVVTFDGAPATILFSNDSQINLVVPDEPSSKTSAQVVVTVDGNSSSPQTVALAPFAPGIFQNGILNQDYSVNGFNNPAPLGSIIQIFATGLSGNGTITAKIAGQIINSPYFAGPAPGLQGVQQVDVQLPTSLAGSAASVQVCGGATPDQVVCSPVVQVALAQ